MQSRRSFIKASAVTAASLSINSPLPPTLSSAVAEKPNPTILLRSSWNDKNIGDIGHTPGTLRILERHLPQAKIILWHASPRPVTEELIRRNFPKVTIVQGEFAGQNTSAEVMKAFESADFYIHNSGMSMNYGLFNYDWGSVMSSLTPFLYCHEKGIPFGLYGHSFDKFAPPSDLLFRDVLSRAAFIYCRDSESVKHIKELGFKAPVMEFAPDGCFGIDVRDEEKGLAYLKANALEEQKFLVVVLRTNTPHLGSTGQGNLMNPAQTPEKKAEDQKRLDKVKALITHWVRTTGHKVLIAPEALKETVYGKTMLYDTLEDDIKSKTVFRETFWNADEAMSVYARAHTIFGMEPHSLIMGLATGVPIMHARPVAHGRKGWMFQDIGLPEWLFDIDEAPASALQSTLTTIVKEYPAAKQKVQKAMTFVAQRQKATMDQLGKILSKSS
ncbi:polysaccharide pyruvyl transferase family protein [Arundinibacter roseus]|uniref:Polysaccharide pyruvyl transferase family protein n=1 Tax=Arundinibacter roseus TaxID=2070510 RepID=A0A4R4KMP6_9BACT|nr:polysaccharide pyruvyl transferase family protein [Arundinibacter roseus]TDB67949.1 polysaccharide pyruvyl transferase family protein [Arundinibacter roseus]